MFIHAYIDSFKSININKELFNAHFCKKATDVKGIVIFIEDSKFNTWVLGNEDFYRSPENTNLFKEIEKYFILQNDPKYSGRTQKIKPLYKIRGFTYPKPRYNSLAINSIHYAFDQNKPDNIDKYKVRRTIEGRPFYENYKRLKNGCVYVGYNAEVYGRDATFYGSHILDTDYNSINVNMKMIDIMTEIESNSNFELTHFEINDFHDGLIRGEKKFYDYNFKEVEFPDDITISYLFSDNYAVAEKESLNKKKAICFHNDKLILLSDKYFNLCGQQVSEYVKFKKNNLFGLLNSDGSIFIDALYNSIDDKFDKLICCQKNRLYGYIDTSGKEIIPFIYGYAQSFVNGLAVVLLHDSSRQNNIKEVIDSKGRTILSLGQDSWSRLTVRIQSNKTIIVNRTGAPYPENDLRIFNFNGEKLNNKNYVHVSDFSEDYAFFIADDYYGFMEIFKNEIIEHRISLPNLIVYYNDKYPGKNLHEIVFLDRKVSKFINGCSIYDRFLTHKFTYLIDKKFSIRKLDFRPRICYDEYYAIEKHNFANGDSWGFVNKNFDIVIDPIFFEVSDFYENHSIVSTGSAYGIINRAGEYVLKPKYKSITRNGHFYIVEKKYFGIINKKGEFCINPKYEDAYILYDGCFLVMQNSKYGMKNIHDKWIISPNVLDMNITVISESYPT